MSTAVAAPSAVEHLVLNISEEIHVRASLEDTFESLLEQLGIRHAGYEIARVEDLEQVLGGVLARS